MNFLKFLVFLDLLVFLDSLVILVLLDSLVFLECNQPIRPHGEDSGAAKTMPSSLEHC